MNVGCQDVNSSTGLVILSGFMPWALVSKPEPQLHSLALIIACMCLQEGASEQRARGPSRDESIVKSAAQAPKLALPTLDQPLLAVPKATAAVGNIADVARATGGARLLPGRRRLMKRSQQVAWERVSSSG